ncbi:YceI family protein [Amycolatopsis cihanbeyliensis]|uniref:Polyisoprenoid-binding protein YceI n=1 Tax=Amycolatopsis cihanbeyliensis TaxID=1128664 RepID=A0A542DDZ5_AMYCI|nr:YceI family protein [Amycolatopsis cihanbeyliensis]TQJ01280.1 polyisoprenoid-binding protein YceI [Amycolatopsis cihanbeyliensis]
MSAPTTEIPGYVAGTWAIDPAHSEVSYSVKHLGLAKSRGNFTAFSGQVVTGENILDSSVTAEIDAGSVSTGTTMRDDHLRTDEFFDVANHPTITFRSTGIRSDGEDYVIDGELTWRGVTKPVSLQAELNGIGTNPANDNATTIGVSAETTVNRRDFGIGPEGSSFLGEKVKITLEIEAALQS